METFNEIAGLRPYPISLALGAFILVRALALTQAARVGVAGDFAERWPMRRDSGQAPSPVRGWSGRLDQMDPVMAASGRPGYRFARSGRLDGNPGVRYFGS